MFYLCLKSIINYQLSIINYQLSIINFSRYFLLILIFCYSQGWATGTENKRDSVFLPSQLTYLETDSLGNFTHKLRLEFNKAGVIILGKNPTKIKAFATYLNSNDAKIGFDTFNLQFTKNEIKVDADLFLNLKPKIDFLKVRCTGDQMSFPKKMCAEDDLEDVSLKTTYFADTLKVLKNQYQFTDFKIKTKESYSLFGTEVTDAYKITSNIVIKSTSQSDKKEKYFNEKLNIWYSPSFGFLKIEQKTKKGKLLRTMVALND